MAGEATNPTTAEGQQPDAPSVAQEATQPKPSFLDDLTFTTVAPDGEIVETKGRQTVEEARAEKAAKKAEEAGQQTGKGEKPDAPKQEDPDAGTDAGGQAKKDDEPGDTELSELVKPDDPKGVKERIVKVVAQRREAERKAEAMQARYDSFEARLNAIESGKRDAEPEGAEEKEPPAAKADGDPTRPARPREDDFDSIEDYEEAREAYFEELAEWKAEQKLQDFQRKQAQDRLNQEYDKLIAEAVKAYPDFVEVALDESLPYTQTMAEAIYASPRFTELAYHLGQNPAEITRIRALDPIGQVRELALIEYGLQGKQQPAKSDNDPPGKQAGHKRITAAGEPIKPVNSGATATPFNPANATAEEMKRYLDAKEIARRKTGGLA